MGSPVTSFAKSGGLHIAYQVVGDGPADLIFIPALFNHVESYWEEPSVARFLHRLASFSRLIIFDKRGTGMSDRVPGTPGLEERIDDVTAVLEAVGSRRTALFGISEGGSIAALFAATYPEAVAALVVMGSGAVGFVTEDEAEALIAVGAFESAWGSGGMLAFGAPSVADNARLVEWAGSAERRG